MGLKATETVTLSFQHTPAERLGDDDFDYSAFIDLGNLVWCAMAVGCCEAVKAYCIDYANQRTAFGEPISHRQSVAFMIADMAIEIDAMRMLVLNAASLAEAGQDFHREAYLARLLCAENPCKLAQMACRFWAVTALPKNIRSSAGIVICARPRLSSLACMPK